MREFMFICDRKKTCRNSPCCGFDCTHTKDKKHMKNPMPKSIQELDRRFEHIRDYEGNRDIWWEVDNENLH